MAAGPRAIWHKASKSIAREVVDELRASLDEQAGRLSALEHELRVTQDQIAALRRAADNDFEVANELAVLQGRLLRSLGDRVERLEEGAPAES